MRGFVSHPGRPGDSPSPRADTLRREVLPDDPLRAIACVIAAGVLFAVSDACSKMISGALPPVQIAWMRWFGFLIVALPALVRSQGAVLRSGAPVMQVARGLGMLGSSIFFIAGLPHLPLATATTITFVSPVIVTLLSIVFLKEQVGIRRWAAVGVGLLGVLIVVRPGLAGFSPASIFPLLSALCWGLASIATRKLAGIDRTWTTMAYTGIAGLAAALPFVIEAWVMPTAEQLVFVAGTTAAAVGAQLFILAAFRRGSASLLAPFTYVQIVWATAFGFAIFGNLPDAWTGVGAAVIIASGLYTAHRERVRMREARVRAAPAPAAPPPPGSRP